MLVATLLGDPDFVCSPEGHLYMLLGGTAKLFAKLFVMLRSLCELSRKRMPDEMGLLGQSPP